ncbi:hypothetical protein RB595_009634 [Gaeumannomyces hyphopodioides]
MYNTLWYLGSIIAAWTTYGCFRIPSDRAWRLPTLLQVVPAAVNLARERAASRGASCVFAREASSSAGSAVLACIVFFMSACNVCWNPLAVAYPVEIMPFSVRAKGIALLMGSIKGASFLNQFVDPIGLQSLSSTMPRTASG